MALIMGRLYVVSPIIVVEPPIEPPEPEIPNNALLDENGIPILDENGDYILVEI